MTNLQSFRIERGEDGITVVTIDMPGQGANTMNARFQADFIELVAQLEAGRETTTGRNPILNRCPPTKYLPPL